MHTDVSYGISNIKKYIIYLYVAWRKGVGKLWRLPYTTHCIQLTTHSLLKYHWRREVFNINSENDAVKTISRLATKLPPSVFGQNYI